MPMQIEKSVVITTEELKNILTKAMQIGDWSAKVIGIEFFFDGCAKVRLRVEETQTQKEVA